jgi:hypothetical protein
MPLLSLRVAGSALFAVAALVGLTAAPADGYTIGNSSASAGVPNRYFGQSFLPTDLGNAGSGAAPASGSVYLTSFSLSLASAPEDATLYLLSQPAATAGSLPSHPNLLASTADRTGNTWSFPGDGVEVDVNTTYYAYVGSPIGLSINLIAFSAGNAYLSGDAYLTNGSNDTFILGQYDDLVFSASFTPVPEPVSLSLLTLGGAALLRRRRA